MNEFELISHLTTALPSNDTVVVGAGDDCAVLDCGDAARQLLFKTDAVVEGVHFTPETPPEKIGRKALARCLSDIAAMGGAPNAALVTIGLPKDYAVERVKKIYSGLNAIAAEFGVAIVGGETTSSPERSFISISLLGYVARDQAVLRSGAVVGDAVFVSGELGGSLQGRHLEFQPRIVEAQWLVNKFPVHAMIDISDGLAGDLRHILHASGVGAELLKSAVPISRAAKDVASRGDAAKPAFVAALTDGEDFELLFTVASQNAVPLLDAWKGEFPATRLSCIGKIIPGKGIRLRDQRGVHQFSAHGYVHFS